MMVLQCECGSEWFTEEQRVKIEMPVEAAPGGLVRVASRRIVYRCGACGKAKTFNWEHNAQFNIPIS